MTPKERLVPVLFYMEPLDLAGIEDWLSDRAAKGRPLHSCGRLLWWFEKSAPKSVRYRLDAVSPLSPTPDYDRRAQNREMGWEFVDSIRYFSVYACEDPAAPEFHADPVTQSYTMDTLARKLKRNLILMPCAILFLLAVCVCGAFVIPPSAWFTDSSLSLMPISFVVVVIWGGILFLQMLRFLRLRRRLQAGLPMEREEHFQGKVVLSTIFYFAFTAFMLLTLYCRWVNLFPPEPQFLSPEDPLPISFGLMQVENDSDFRHGDGENTPASSFQTGWSLPFPTQYHITEGGTTPVETSPDGYTLYGPLLYTDYYKALFPALAPWLLRTLELETAKLTVFDGSAAEVLSCPGLDRAVLFRAPENACQTLLACSGNMVVRARYWDGGADLADSLPALAAALAQLQSDRD